MMAIAPDVAVALVVDALACPAALVLHLVSPSSSRLRLNGTQDRGTAGLVEAGEVSRDAGRTSSAVSPALGP